MFMVNFACNNFPPRFLDIRWTMNWAEIFLLPSAVRQCNFKSVEDDCTPYNAGDTQSRILYKKLVQVSSTRNLHQILMKVSCTRNLQIIKKQLQTTHITKQQTVKSTNKPFNHISQFCSRVCKFLALNRALFYLIQDSCTRKKLVQESMHDTQSSFLYKSTCTSFLYKILDCVTLT